MALFVEVTEECRKSARTHGGEAQLDDLVMKIEHEQNDDMFEKSPKPFVVRRNFLRRAGRLLGVKRFVRVNEENHAVLILLSVMMYDADHYDQRVCLNAQNFYEENFARKLTHLEGEALRQYVEQRLQHEVPESKPRLSNDELSYLHASSVFFAQEELVCESRNWMNAVLRPELKDVLVRVRDALEMIHSGGEESCGELLDFDVPKSSYRESIAKSSGGAKDLVVYYQWISKPLLDVDGKPRIDEYGREVKTNLLYLCDVVTKGTRPQGVIPKDELDISSAEKYFFRTYPSYMLSDDKRWVRQEREQYGNFALSKEEVEALSIPIGETSVPFPLFVNGRAGSGKSTVLAYLYADYYARYISPNKSGTSVRNLPPAYFACNQRLLDRAQELVTGILQNNVSYDLDYEQVSGLSEDAQFRSSFKVYRDFLMSLIPTTGKGLLPRVAAQWGKSSESDAFVDFGRFREMWKDFPDAKSVGCGPDVSWHLIRTYIKGWSSEGFVETADELEALLLTESGNNEALVKSGLARRVFEKVWVDWYKKLTAPEPGNATCFDDQDLVRYVLDEGLLEKMDRKFLGIFADEAQDFTRCEIRSLLRMTIYSDRTIDAFNLKNLPFVFAGDEFQTLNPTGFRWDVMRTNFVESLIENLCPSGDKQEINFRDLIHNYRSRNNIVRMGNLVQLDRAVKLKIPDLKPQIPWRTTADNDGNKVFLYDEKVESLWAAFKSYKADKALIVPCLEAEEEKYIADHPELAAVIERNSDNTTNPPVFSVVAAKGLDFDATVVYGFGQEFAQEQERSGFGTSGDEMKLAYFMNRLYVALTRAKVSMVIVDPSKSFKSMWNRYMDSSGVLDAYAQSYGDDGNLELWRENICSVSHNQEGVAYASVLKNGDPDDAMDVFSQDFVWDPQGTARRYEEVGMQEKSPKMMNLAASWYRKSDYATRDNDATRCAAYAKFFEGDVKTASMLFAEIGLYNRACECWWSEKPFNYERLASVPQSAWTQYPYPSRFRVARACYDGSARALSEVLHEFAFEKIDEDVSSAAWRDVIRQCARLIISAKDVRGEALAALPILVEKKLLSIKPKQCEALVDKGIYDIACRLYDSASFNQRDLDQEKFRKAHFETADLRTVWSYLPNQCSHEDYRRLAELYSAADSSARLALSDDGRKQLIDAFAHTVGLSEVVREIGKVKGKDFKYLKSLARRIKSGEARRALNKAAYVAKYEEVYHADAVDSLAVELPEIVKACGEEFVIRLLARMTSLQSGPKPPTKMPILISRVEYIFSRNMPRVGHGLSIDEFDLAFERYASRTLREKHREHAVSRMYDLTAKDWETLRTDVLCAEAFAVDAVYAEEVIVEDDVHEVETEAESASAREVPTAVPTLPTTTRSVSKIVWMISGVSITYSPGADAIKILLPTEGETWKLTPSGLKVEDDERGYCEDLPLPSTGLSVSVDPAGIRIQDAARREVLLSVKFA